jgi:hypothetical protein
LKVRWARIYSDQSMESERAQRLSGDHLFINLLRGAFGAGWRMGIMGAATGDIHYEGVWTGATLCGTGRGRAGVLSGGVWFCVPVTGRVVGTA